MLMFFIQMRKGKKLKTSRHASAAATRNDRLPHSRQYYYYYYIYYFSYNLIITSPIILTTTLALV